jgi:hypothetical protein
MKTCLLKAAAIAAFALCSTVASNAAPGPIGRGVTPGPGFDEIASRRCYWLNGVRYCRLYRAPRTYGYEGPHYPEAYPTGSQRWWQEMDRQDRGGRGGRR